MHNIYKNQLKNRLSNLSLQKVSDSIYVTLFLGLTLQDYVSVHNRDCEIHHVQPCKHCKGMLSVAFSVLENGFVALSKAFHLAFPDQSYKIDIALARLLHLPLAVVCKVTPKSGKAMWFPC